MPQLIKGQIRFTDEDYAMTEFNDKVQTQFASTKTETLYTMLKEELGFQSLLKEHEITEKFDITNNIKMSLATSLSILSAIAKNEGYALNDLIHSFIQ
jgi:hypothetical protein